MSSSKLRRIQASIGHHWHHRFQMPRLVRCTTSTMNVFPSTGARDNDGIRHLWPIYLQEARRGDNCHVRRARTPRRWARRRRSATTLTPDAEDTACCSDYRHSVDAKNKLTINALPHISNLCTLSKLKEGSMRFACFTRGALAMRGY